MKILINRLLKLPSSYLWAAAIAATILQYAMMSYLNSIYAATGFPVSYMVGQTAFDGTLIKGYYSVLIEKGTFDDYIMVQLIDFIFMITVFLAHLIACVALYTALPSITWLRKIGMIMAFVTPLAAAFDAFENLVSFLMLANPTGFANWLAYPYSSFAVVKFFLFTVFMAWLAFATLAIITTFVHSKLSAKASPQSTS